MCALEVILLLVIVYVNALKWLTVIMNDVRMTAAVIYSKYNNGILNICLLEN